MKNPSLAYLAKSFYNAYIALDQLEPPQDELLLYIPKLVNGAFSAELIIKAILVEQDIPYNNEHNLKILFEKLPVEIQKRVWRFLAQKASEYADVEKRENELLLMSDAFVQWRYCYEGNLAPAFDIRFLSAFTNALIIVMFELGYNVFFTKSEIALSPEECAEIDNKIENNRRECMKNNEANIKKKSRR